ncbi:hypothetical protein C8035_v011306 [Colletotrichum spinosum]|uniref:Integral membrane protein n=1 Tax=Colletotrichum spinosum TaxID=1347390 RepID=A0A4R8PYA8_9PEZI|nr:hypothetical protein C8035_v011306 [Colletotrichum spinosum]
MVTNPRLQASEAYRMPVDIMPEVRATQNEPISTSRKLSARLEKHVGNDSIVVSHGSEADALTIALNCTIRVPDNRDTNNLPPGLGTFPLFNVKDYAHKLPESMARKGGIFFPMYQKEAMWINFSASAPFAVKIYVGGVNAVSGFPMTANDQTKAKRKRMLQNGESIQDYMVLPEQRWLDGIVSEDGKIRQFVAQPKGSGYSVEAQVTGEENVGGIQIEIVPAKKNLPASFDVRYENKSREVVTRTFNLAEKAITGESTWRDVKKSISGEFGIPVEDQVLRDYSLVGRSYPPQSHGINSYDVASNRLQRRDQALRCLLPAQALYSLSHPSPASAQMREEKDCFGLGAWTGCLGHVCYALECGRRPGSQRNGSRSRRSHLADHRDRCPSCRHLGCGGLRHGQPADP